MGYNDSWQVRLARSLSRVRADLSFALVDAVLVAVTYTAALVLAFLDTSTDPSRWWGNFLVQKANESGVDLDVLPITPKQVATVIECLV